MSHVRDLWTKTNPEGGKRLKSARWGRGNRWLAVWQEQGREVTKSFSTKDGALGHLARVDVAVADGVHVSRDRAQITLGDLWEGWIQTKSLRKESTISGYTAAWKHINKDWGTIPCQKVSRIGFQKWLTTVPLSAASLRKIGIVFHALLNVAVDENIIPKNPLRPGDIPRQKTPERRYLTVSELDRLLGAAPDSETNLVMLVLVRTGVRPGEAFALRVMDLDIERKRLRIQRAVTRRGDVDETKTKRHRDVPIGGVLLEQLVAATKNRRLDDLILVDSQGAGWTRDKWRYPWKRICQTAGIDIDTYELRHTAASLAIHAGANVKTVQQMLGHMSASVTLDTYSHLWDEELDSIPERVDLLIDLERSKVSDRTETEQTA